MLYTPKKESYIPYIAKNAGVSFVRIGPPQPADIARSAAQVPIHPPSAKVVLLPPRSTTANALLAAQWRANGRLKGRRWVRQAAVEALIKTPETVAEHFLDTAKTMMEENDDLEPAFLLAKVCVPVGLTLATLTPKCKRRVSLGLSVSRCSRSCVPDGSF
jgi:hypothetical protein